MLLYKKEGVREKGFSALTCCKASYCKKKIIFLFCTLPCINTKHEGNQPKSTQFWIISATYRDSNTTKMPQSEMCNNIHIRDSSR